MKSAQILREKIANEDRVTTGMICTFHFWPGMIEMAMKANLDYVIIDLEHLTFDAAMVAEACAIGRRQDFPVLIRPPAAEYTPVRLAMDLGPCGLLVPMVENVETVQVIQDAVYMKPRGRRRPGGMGNFWVRDYNYETWKNEVEDDFIILPQIESRLGLSHVTEIANHRLTTAIAVGPYDLSADLGVCYDPSAAAHREAIQTIRAAGRAAGKPMWMIGDGLELASAGFRFLCVTEPTMFLQAKLSELNAATRASGESGDGAKGVAADEATGATDLPLP